MKSKNKVHLIVVFAIAIFISLTTLTACNGTGIGDIGDIINSAISSGSDTGTDSTFCAHNYANGICTICGKEQPLQTEGLAYALNSDNVSYSCIGMGTATATSIFIADEYNGLPVTSIGESAFYNCDSLTSIVISDSITSIGDWAFYNCSGLTSVVIGNGVTTIGDSTFSWCRGLTSVIMPNSVTLMGDYVFECCTNLKSIVIPDSVTSIGFSTFISCESLTSVVIGNGVTTIGDSAFNWCRGLTSVTIGSSVTMIGDDSFMHCPRLVEVINYSSLNITKGSFDFGAVGYYALNVKQSGDSDIGNKDGYLFYTCDNVNYLLGYSGNNTELVLPDSYNGQTYEINKNAFYDCNGLTSVVIPDSVTSIGNGAFSGCSGLTSAVIPDSVTSIGAGLFYECTNLMSVSIGNKVKSIGYDVFYDCRRLTSIVIGNSVTSISESAFRGCTSLKYNKYDNAYYLGNENNTYYALIKDLQIKVK